MPPTAVAEPALLRSIRRFAAEGAEGSPPHIPYHKEREGLELVLEVLRGREKKLHVAALRVIDRAGIIEPENVPPGLVEEVCRLACEGRTCEAASDAFKRLEVRKAIAPEHHELVLAADERRLAMILGRLRAGGRPGSTLRAQLLRVRNPRLPPLFTPDLMALKPAGASQVLELFHEVYTAARSTYDKEQRRTVALEGESGFDPTFVRALLARVGDDRIAPTWMLPRVALLQRFGEDISSAKPALWRMAVEKRFPDAARLLIPELLERHAWAELVQLVDASEWSGRDVTSGLARLVSSGDPLAGAAELIDRLGRPDEIVFALWRREHDVVAVADHLMSDEVRCGERKGMVLAQPLLGDVVALLAERAARRAADATAALAALAELGQRGDDIERARDAAARLCTVPELGAHALAVLARMPTPQPALLADYAAVLTPDCPASLALHVLDGLRRAIDKLWDRPHDPGLAAVLPALRGLWRHENRAVRRESVSCLCSAGKSLGPPEVDVLVESMAGIDDQEPNDQAIPTLCMLAARGLDVGAAEPHLPAHLERAHEDGVHPALLLAHIRLRRGQRFPKKYRRQLSRSRSAPWGPNEAAYPVLERLAAGDPELAAWLLATLEKERKQYAIDGGQLDPEDDKLRAACAAALPNKPPASPKPKRKPRG